MQIIVYTGGFVSTNGYVVHDDDHCIVVDAPAGIAEMIEKEGLKPSHLLLTHQHFDHTEDVEALQKLGAKVVAYSPYSETLIRQKEARDNWGIPVQIAPFTPDHLLEGEFNFNIENISFAVSHIPGHSPDSIAFYCPELSENGIVFVGDTLMAGGMGRTDLPGGSMSDLVNGIKTHLYTLPDDTLVLSGHGPETTIGNEKEHNHFI